MPMDCSSHKNNHKHTVSEKRVHTSALDHVSDHTHPLFPKIPMTKQAGILLLT